MGAPRHILATRFSSLGDILLTSGTLAWLRERAPDAKLTLLTKAAWAPLFEGQAWADQVWSLETLGGLGGVLDQAKAEGVDAYLDLHSNLRSRALGWRLRVPTARVRGYSLQRRLRVLRPGPQPARLPHVSRRYLEAAAGLLGEAAPAGLIPAPQLRAPEAAVAKAREQLSAWGWQPGQRVLAMAPGAAWATKRWSAEHFAQAIALVAEGEQVRFVLLGSEAEAPLAEAVLQRLRKAKHLAHNACGDGGLLGLAGWLSVVDAALTHDSGPMHLACALGKPVTALFGPTVEDFGFFPLGPRARVIQEASLECRPCSLHGGERCPLGHHDCMRNIEPFAVAAACRQALGFEGVY